MVRIGGRWSGGVIGIYIFFLITAGLYSGPTALFAAIFPYCRRWLQAICIFTTDVLPEMGRL